MIQSQRNLFDIPKHVAYFNCAYSAPLLNKSVAALYSGVNSKKTPWEINPPDFFTDAEEIRVLAADLFGGDSHGYAIVPSASYGLSTAARIVESGLYEGQEILILDEEFPSIVYPLRRVATETGAKIVTVKTPQNGNWTDAILTAIHKNTEVVALSACHWTNGAYIDLLKIREACDTVQAILIIDATQSMGAMPLDVDKIRPDFLVVAGYKWLLCPYGFGLMYVDEKWRNQRPLEETWIARENAMDFTNLVNYSDKYMQGARRFEVGEKCVPTILPGAIEALKQIKQWGIQNIADTLAEINMRISKQLLDLGFRIPDLAQRCPHMLGAELPSNYTGNLVSELKAQNIYISQRGKSLRFAPHLYIDEYDIQRLLDSIQVSLRTM